MRANPRMKSHPMFQSAPDVRSVVIFLNAAVLTDSPSRGRTVGYPEKWP
jgi:hypothetical protein